MRKGATSKSSLPSSVNIVSICRGKGRPSYWLTLRLIAYLT